MSEMTLPRTNLEKELVRVWERVLKRSPIGVNEDFFDLGGTSVQAARIFAEIEEIFHQRFPLSCILGSSTIEQLAAALIPGKSRERKAWVVPIQAEGEKPVLYCVGGGSSWRAVSDYLGPDQPIFSIGLDPGEVEQATGANPMQKLSRHLVTALLEKQERGPFYLTGFCQDGLFAYEVAQQLKMYGHEVGLLVLIETRNPSPQFRVRMRNGLRRNAIQFVYQLSQLRRLIRTGEFSQYGRERREQLNRFRQRLLLSASRKLQTRTRRRTRVDAGQFLYIASRFSKPKPLNCPTVIFRCTDWPTFSAGDPYLGWAGLLTGPCETHSIPGDHEGILREPNVRVFAEKLRVCLQNQAQAARSSYDLVSEGAKTRQHADNSAIVGLPEM
jgi:thioesterase domain-containing protein